VPPRYFGVWSRTLLQTPQLRDTSTFVRWMQLGRWHVDLRVAPGGARQGFCGVTQVRDTPVGEVCTWQRLVDYLPPRATADEGVMVFETPERVTEDGIHSSYHEVWERVPGATGRRIALAEPARADGQASARIFVSGDCLMRVRPAAPGDAAFEISFGHWDGGLFRIAQSLQPGLVGHATALQCGTPEDGSVELATDKGRSRWQVLEWAAD
jgi:hypothetical protein